MTSIPCQRCKDEPEDEKGCPTCGGHRNVLIQCKCSCGGTKYWARPGAHTMYEGKRWASFDGVDFVVENGSAKCPACRGGK